MENGSKKVEQVLKMKGGVGEESYANNSKSQTSIISKEIPTFEQAIQDLCSTELPETVTIADLGCSSGPNTLFAISQIMVKMNSITCCQMGKSPLNFQVFLNDLPGNDFNTVFKSLPGFLEKMKQELGENFGSCFIGAFPGSFYDRLFPSKSLHFVHSSSSLHWLSRVPRELNDKEKGLVNKGKIYISKTSSIEVINAYLNQFQRDFSSFLKSRAEEIAPGGRMVLTFRGRRMPDPTLDESCLLWDYLAQAFQDLVNKGFIEQEKLDSYNTPCYDPYIEDIKAAIINQGSFAINRLEIVSIPWDGVSGGQNYNRASMSRQMAKAIRAINESMFQSHFGAEIMDELFTRFIEIMAADTKEIEHVSVVVYVSRNA